MHSEDRQLVEAELNNRFRVVEGVIKRKRGQEIAIDLLRTHILTNVSAINLTPINIQTIIEEWRDAHIAEAARIAEELEAIERGDITLSMTKQDDIFFRKYKWFTQEGGPVMVTNLNSQGQFKSDNENTYTVIDTTIRYDLAPHQGTFNKLKNMYNRIVQKAKENQEVPPFMIWKVNTKWSERAGRWIYPREHYNFETYLDMTQEEFIGNQEYYIKEPKYISKDASEPAFLHIDPEQFDKTECPTWDNWVNLRFEDEDKPLFKAAIYSIFDPDNQSRQGIWLYDGGQTGKSTIISMLYQFLGKSACALSNPELSGATSRFTGSKILGKRLATIADCKNYSVIRTGIIHNILGNDPISIEGKGKQAYSARVHCRVLIGANKLPEIDVTRPHETSRMLIFKLRENSELTAEERASFQSGAGAAKLDGKLLQECEAFIASCREDYLAICGEEGGNIVLNKDKEERMFELVTTPEVENFHYLIDEYMDIKKDSEHTTPRIVIQALFKELYPDRTDGFTYSNFLGFLGGAGATQGFKASDTGGNKTRVWKGLKLKDEVLNRLAVCQKNTVIYNYLQRTK